MKHDPDYYGILERDRGRYKVGKAEFTSYPTYPIQNNEFKTWPNGRPIFSGELGGGNTVQQKTGKTPHKCPVCEGKGIVWG